MSLEVVRILAERHKDVFFTGLFSQSPYASAEHQIYYDELMKFVADNKLEENVSIIRGYQSNEVLDSYMRTNQAVLFPYISHPKHEVFGASGAARMGMSKAVPVVTTSVNHFSDLPTLKGDNPEELANILDKIFSDPIAKKKQIDRQLKYVEENSWEKIANQYLVMFAHT
jgi:glycosyltransferase involved in cell wall biosynthesis